MYTIAGAKKQLSRSGEKSSAQLSLKLPQSHDRGLLKKIEKELLALVRLFDE